MVIVPRLRDARASVSPTVPRIRTASDSSSDEASGNTRADVRRWSLDRTHVALLGRARHDVARIVAAQRAPSSSTSTRSRATSMPSSASTTSARYSPRSIGTSASTCGWTIATASGSAPSRYAHTAVVVPGRSSTVAGAATRITRTRSGSGSRSTSGTASPTGSSSRRDSAAAQPSRQAGRGHHGRTARVGRTPHDPSRNPPRADPPAIRRRSPRRCCTAHRAILVIVVSVVDTSTLTDPADLGHPPSVPP